MGISIDKSARKEVLDIIQKEYGGKIIELDYETPFQLLCAVVLSAQTTDKQVNKVTPTLFARVREASDLRILTLDEIESLLSAINFYRNKSHYIKALAEKLDHEKNGVIPNDLTYLQTLPGVGIKTAKVVLSVLYDMPYVGVDTHIHRVLNRLGWVQTESPNATDRAIESLLTREEKQQIHHPLVLFWRYRCIARKPRCSDCPIQKYCQFSREK